MSWISIDTRNQNRWGWNDPIGAEAENNAKEVWRCLSEYMTVEACCGILGNMSAESHINPMQEQIFNLPLPPQQQRGLGLIQWTPQSSLTEFCDDYTNGDDQCLLIWNELNGYTGGRWLPTSEYPYTGLEYTQLTDVDLCARAYFEERESGTWSDFRVEWANHWLNIIGGSKRRMPLYFYMGKSFKRKKGLIK